MSADEELTALVAEAKTVLAELKATREKITKYNKEVHFPFREAGLHKTHPDLDARASLIKYDGMFDVFISELESIIRKPTHVPVSRIKRSIRDSRKYIDIKDNIPELTAAINHVLYKPADEEGPAGPEAMKLFAKNPPSNVHYGEAGGRRKTRKHKRKVKRSRRYTKTN
jgi:hypothetical protein